MTEATTQGIKISVNTVFCGVQERNQQKHYLYDYYISIENLSPHTVQLFSRHWEIYDSLNHTEIVEGDGVVGIQPILKSGEKHAYKSHCILLSNCGSMKGYYTMLNLDEKKTFRVTVPSFQLQTKSIMN
ncbi:Co2+/Mg2+ efflux protein ApaG [Wenyingzhuangia sp. chi5]|uniref:Co2+/Mg2+ efflux protein ApaG n=1 Tax=Wenyingzhuangia gilva TaxID=3057677 RepID=A0ABT8VV70_9FLAO|nr:Co2+/Mg2+ efflux protein ApaG [Wenyingzhuangia sp. chi5]MDO3695871.1 Co2+/Mg2+ efflux protein ApaG [Wenyingzhuangia sp. chi5]